MKIEHYSISIEELLDRPLIRDDKPYEYLNKMTDFEIEQYYKEVDMFIKQEGDNVSYSSSHLSKMIDREILYELFKQFKHE